jgi:hypothetical protein
VEQLATEFKAQNRTLKQIKRNGMVALYELYGAQGLLYGFEVAVIRVRKAHEAFGRQFPEMEGYPLNEEWGTYGFSYSASDLNGATKKFHDLLPKYGTIVVRQVA